MQSSPSQPFPERAKKFRKPGNCGARPCPGEGQMYAAKTGAGLSVAGAAFHPLEPKREFFSFYESVRKRPASLCGSQGSVSGSCISRGVLVPPKRDKFAPPPDDERGLRLPPLIYFHRFSAGGGIRLRLGPFSLQECGRTWRPSLSPQGPLRGKSSESHGPETPTGIGGRR